VEKRDMSCDVLVAGAGPTGLVLALQLARAGVRVRIVDAAAEPGTRSRALVVHARTLEFYQQMGIAEAFLAEGLRFEALNLWVRKRRVARARVGAIATGSSPFPFMQVCPQDRHERFLAGQLEKLGIGIERSTELVAFQQTRDEVRVQLASAGGAEERVARRSSRVATDRTPGCARTSAPASPAERTRTSSTSPTWMPRAR
jgi:2-polyprenyl-6-methoxyphenol hydroxylase-like FAD-dependent oxidoreductase